jgi:arylsulfatase A-like enzyme
MLPTKRICLVFSAALLYTLSCGCGQPDPGGPSRNSAETERQPPNLLLVVVDTLRLDHLGFYGYTDHPSSPTLDAWARQSVVVEGLVGVSSWTMPSMATLYTGLTPAEHRVMRMTGPQPDSRLREAKTLAAVMREQGYATACMMSNFLLLGRRGFNQGFDLYDDSFVDLKDPHRGSTADAVADHGIQWLQKHADSQTASKPWLLNLHFFDPHTSYEDHADWNFADPKYSGWVKGGLQDADYKANQASSSASDRAQLGAYYAEEIRAVDRALAKVQRYLQQTGEWQNTLVVVTSDHGEELAERGYIGHTRTLHFEQIDLPLLVRFPGQAHAGERRSGAMSQIDLYATVLDLVGLQPPPERGSSKADWLRGSADLESDQAIFFEVDFLPVKNDPARLIRLQGVKIASLGKFVVDLKTGAEYFFLPTDTLELNNRISDPGAQPAIKALRVALAAHRWYIASKP